MKNISISVIVPVYNKEQFINKCLGSIKKQDITLSFEVIIIDDGSTDNSSKIIKTFCRKDKRFRYYYEKNQGVSSARNYGIEKANGKCLVFIDGDDYLDPDYLKKLYKNFSKSSLVMCGYKHVMDNKHVINYRLQRMQIHRPNFIKFVFRNPNFKFICTPYSKMFDSKIIKKYRIRFDEKTSFGEDTIFVFDYLAHSSTINVCSYTGYNNRIVKNTLSRKKISQIWQMNKYIIQKGDEIFNFKYDSSWAFLYLRSIKLSLLNNVNNYNSFRKQIHIITSDADFEKINIYNLSKKDKILIIFIKYKLTYLIYIIIKQISYRQR